MPSADTYFYKNSTQTSFDAGLLLGYQHFFDQNKVHGPKASFHLYGGSGEKLSGSANTLYTYEVDYTPIKTGLDLSYIFNFYNQGVHEVGFGVGIGYGVNAYFSSNGQITDFLNEISILKARNLIIHGVYPTLGFYYTLQQHHKFEINYRYTGFIQQSRPDDTIVLESSGKALGPIYYKLQYSSYFVLNYSYIF